MYGSHEYVSLGCSPTNIASNCSEPDSYHFTADRICVAGCGGSFSTITECVEQCGKCISVTWFSNNGVVVYIILICSVSTD